LNPVKNLNVAFDPTGDIDFVIRATVRGTRGPAEIDECCEVPALDLIDALFSIEWLLFDEPKEGRVEFCSVHFGDVLRDDDRMKHLDDVNQPPGSTVWFDTDPKDIFRTHVDRLENASL
jgi:hypothetical protein